MKKKEQLIKYEKEGCFERIKNKIKSAFKKKEDIKSNYSNTKINSTQLNKEGFFEIYEKVKNNEINIESLDKETIKKILQMIIEELNINSNKINDKLTSFKISLDNTKMYNKEIEIYMNQNS